MTRIMVARGLRTLLAMTCVLCAANGAAWAETLAEGEARIDRLEKAIPALRAAKDPRLIKAHLALVDLYRNRGRFQKAHEHIDAAIALREAEFGPDHVEVASVLRDKGTLYAAMGDVQNGKPLYERALAIQERDLGPDDPQVATTLTSLAEVYRARGEPLLAEPLYLRALKIFDGKLGPDNAYSAATRTGLGQLYSALGDRARARDYHERALKAFEASVGPEHFLVAHSLSYLARLDQAEGKLRSAQTKFTRALKIFVAHHGKSHPDVASTFNSLSHLHLLAGDIEVAERLCQHALKIQRASLGSDHFYVGLTLAHLADMRRRQGKHAEALTLYREVLGIYAGQLGENHPFVAQVHESVSRICQVTGDANCALTHRQLGNEVLERNLGLVLTAGSESQKRAYMATVTTNTHATVSYHLRSASEDPAAARLAMLTLLRRKGRVLDAQTDTYAALRRGLDPRGVGLLEKLTALRSKQASLALDGAATAGTRDTLAALEGQVDALEREIATVSAAFGVSRRPVTLASIQAAIPAGGALVEYVVYRPFSPDVEGKQRWAAPRYAAYVLHGDGGLKFADLGEAGPIDELVAKLRAGITGRADIATTARATHSRVWEKLVPLLRGKSHVLVSPDGALQLLPFDALIDPDGAYLIENTLITYLTTGRDLVRFDDDVAPRQGPLLVADPDYQTGGAGGSERAAPTSADLASVSWVRLPGTAAEAEAIAGILPDARLLTGAEAAEPAIKAAQGPSILHVAAHGFFLQDETADAEEGARGFVAKSGITLTPSGSDGPRVLANPLLRSGLVLTGANKGGTGADDGYLTASEVSALDLWGTRLVVLSACETGVGEVRNGQGVYGLRRALVLAGAQSQVMSLWQVSDDATRALMIEYYRALQAGAGRSQAMRQARLHLLDTGPWRHPYFWAAFIPSGDWRGMGGVEAEMTVPGRLPPTNRGCACDVSAPSNPMAALAVLALGLALRIRRR